MTTDRPAPRKRGAPLGNTNAVKHGYYSHRINPGRGSFPANPTRSGLADQIALMRAYFDQVIRLSAGYKQVRDWPGILNALSLTVKSISFLIEFQQRMGGSMDTKSYHRRILAEILEALSSESAETASGAVESMPQSTPEAQP
jgi:hypothetical protein